MVCMSLSKGLAYAFHAAILAPIPHVLGAVVGRITARDGSTPSLNFDPNTTKDCTWWVDLNSNADCAIVLAENFITLETFRRWNPSIPATCSVLQAGQSYCVEAMFESLPTSAPQSTVAPSSTPPATTTKPWNGIDTPLPTQPLIVDNCNAFYFVKTGDNCYSVAAAHGITFQQLFEWNPSVGPECNGLWSDAYVCVSTIGWDAPTPTTSPGNGIASPTPTQPGMVSNCEKFTFVHEGDTCNALAFLNAVSVEDIIRWNTGVREDCGGLWANVYLCIGVIGGGTPTQPGNGIATPTPTHPGMVNNCNKFTFVHEGDSCNALAFFNGIATEELIRWNTGIGNDCRGLWANTYVCIGV